VVHAHGYYFSTVLVDEVFVEMERDGGWTRRFGAIRKSADLLYVYCSSTCCATVNLTAGGRGNFTSLLFP
jgi:hypothetical protein